MNKEQQEAALKLCAWLLSPDGGGYSVGPWERDMARIATGLKPVECVIKVKPRIWRSRNGYWICNAEARQGYGAHPAEAYGDWLLGGRR